MSTPRFHALSVSDTRRETSDCISVAFAVPHALREAYRFAPGQYLTLRTTLNGAECRRSYSICAGLDDDELRVAIKCLNGGAFSTWANAALRPGDRLDVMTPMGRFGNGLFDAGAWRRGRTYVAFAAGSGITPVMSILKTALGRERDSRFVLFYGNRTSSSIIFREQLEDLKDRHLSRLSVFHVLSREQQDVAALNGRLTAERVATLMRTAAPLDEIDRALVCGPLAMIEGLEKALLDLGLPRARVDVERFTPAPGGAPAPPRPLPEPGLPPTAQATVIVGGARRKIALLEHETIIDGATRAGIDLPYSCKGGMCCTCRARVLEGRVEMAVNYSLEPWETEAGFVLTCQSRPTTSHVVIDYDQV